MSETNMESVAAPVELDAPIENNSETELLEGESLDDIESEEPKPAPVEEPKSTKRKYVYRADGQDISEELDDAELTKRLALSKGAMSKMQKAAEAEKEKAQLEGEVKQLLDLLKTNPLALLKNPELGVDVRKLVEDYIKEDFANQEKAKQDAAKTPEQKALEAAIAEAEETKKELARIKKESADREFEAATKREMESYQNEFRKAITAGDLPDSPYIMSKMADMMLTATKAGVQVTPAELVPLVREQYIEEFKSMIGAKVPDEVIEEILGGERIKALRSKQLARLKTTTPIPEPIKEVRSQPVEPKETEKSEKQLSFRDVFGINI